MRQRAPVFIALVVTALIGSGSAVGATASQADVADFEGTESFIVVLEDSKDAPSIALEHTQELDVDTRHVFEHALDGYSAELTAEQVAEIEADPDVAFVEPDVTLEIQQQPVPTGVQRVFGPENPNLGIGGPDDLRVDVDIAVIDTGVSDHNDLDVVDRVSCLGFGGCSPGGLDGNGHGTHVAGSAAAINNGSGVVGTAPGARVWSVQVCNAGGSCSLSSIIAGIDYVTANADSIEVANMSLGGPGTSSAQAQAITNSVNAGVVYVVAAGNSNANANGFQPANHPDVVTVSALADSDGQPGGTGGPPSCRPQSQDDHLADFSNWGPAINVAAPGTCINSTWNNGGFNVISGTSMASPHAAGAAGVLASGDNAPSGRADVLAIRDTLEATGNFDWTFQSRGAGDFHEPLLDISDGSVFPPSGPLEPPDDPDPPDPGDGPQAAFSANCNPFFVWHLCQFNGSGSEGDIVSWSWDFGDGTSGSGQSVNKLYFSGGSFTVTLTVTDSDGATDSTSQNINL